MGKSIKQLKEENPGREMIEISGKDSRGQIHKAVYMEPELVELAPAMPLTQSDPYSALLIIWNAVKVDGSDAFIKDKKLFMGLMAEFGQYLQGTDLEVKKL